MKATYMFGAGDVRVVEVSDPVIKEPTDALVRVVLACVCGSDLHPFHSMPATPEGTPMGHEFVGVVEEIGGEVSTVAPGDLVIAPFAWSDGTCEFCRAGLQTSCLHGGFWARGEIGGGQAEAIRVPLADGTLVKAPVGEDSALLPSLLTLSDVYGTGYHAAIKGGVTKGSVVTVIGDGAVGLLAVLSAKQLGAEQIVLMGRHARRTDLGREFGATDVVAERGEEGIAKVRRLTGGHGSQIVIEAVGHMPAYEQAVGVVRPGGDQPGRCAAVRAGAGRVRQPVRPQHHPHWWPRAGSCLHRAADARGPRRNRRTGQGAAGPGQHRRRTPPTSVRPAVQQVLDAITDAPAWVRNGRHDTVAMNRLARALYSPVLADPRRPANTTRFTYLDPAARDFFVDWERVANDAAAMLRLEAGRTPHDPALIKLVGELSTQSEVFRKRWASQDVQFHRSGRKRLRHPIVGHLDLNFESMELPSEPGLTLNVYTAAPGSPAADALKVLASWAATQELTDESLTTNDQA